MVIFVENVRALVYSPIRKFPYQSWLIFNQKAENLWYIKMYRTLIFMVEIDGDGCRKYLG